MTASMAMLSTNEFRCLLRFMACLLEIEFLTIEFLR